MERAQNGKPITEEAPDSVLSGRTIDEIASAGDRVWQSNRAEGESALVNGQRNSRSATAPKVRLVRDWSKELHGAPKESLPSFIEPQLASPVKSPPPGAKWIHEIKLDGYRILVRVGEGRVQLLTRTGLDWTHRMKAIASAASALPVKTALIDGEAVVLTEEGISSFAELQAAFQKGAKPLTYFAFDLLHFDGHNLRGLALKERKHMLERLLEGAREDGVIRLSEHIEGSGAQVFRKACNLGTEGIISKRADGNYDPGRGGGWLKIKCYREHW